MLSLLGFDTDELDRLLNGSSEENVVAEGETDADAVPDVPEEPVSQRGVIYQLGKHRLMCGDSTRAEDVAQQFAQIPLHQRLLELLNKRFSFYQKLEGEK